MVDEITALRSSLDNLEQLVGLEHRYIQRMQERDLLYRLVLDSTRDWIVCFDQQGMIADANRSVAQALACSEFDLVGRRVHELRLQRRVADSWELCRRAASRPDAFIQHEAQGVFPDGNTYSLQTFFRPIDDGRGGVAGVIMVGRDAAGGSPSVQAEAPQTLDHALYQEFAGIAYRGDPGQRFSTLHGRVEEITGYPPEELLEITWESLVHLEDRPGLMAAYELLQSAPDLALDQEYRIRTKQGEWRWVREIVRAMCDPSGAPIAAEGIIQDISLRKDAEQSLEELASAFRAVLAAGPGAVQLMQPGQLAAAPVAQQVLGGPAVACFQQAGLSAPCSDCAALRAAESRQTETCQLSTGEAWFECSAHPLLDERGQTKLIVQHLQNVSERVNRSRQLESRLQRFGQLLDAMPQAVMLVGEDHRIAYANQLCRTAIGDHSGQACYQLLGNVEPCAACPLQAVWQGQAEQADYQLRCYGRVLAGQARRIRLDGEMALLFSLNDITETAEQQRRGEYYHLLAERGRDIVLVADLHGNILEVNAAASQVYGYSSDELLRMTLGELGEMERLTVAPSLEQRQNGVSFETSHRKRDGTLLPVEVSSQWAEVEGQTVTISLVRDLSAQKAELQAVQTASMHDALTGLYNRSCLERLDEFWQQESNYPLSLIMGDVNGLKLANDAFGYAVGDELIKAVARSIQANCLRASDIAIRWGGDEFVIILPATAAAEASLVCERVRQTAAAVKHVAVAPSAAWGIATALAPGLSLPMLLKQAEERMQHNKLLESHRVRVEIVASLHHRLQWQALETAEHTDRVQQLAVGIGRLLGLEDDELQRLSQLALLHDLGKVAIPEAILQKPEQLSREEWMAVQRHPEIGYRIASSLPELMQISDEILGHHEHWDGTGYPRRLRGEEIPLLARIVSIADAYAVMTAGRPYRPALSHPAAAGELVRCAGTQFDPRLVRMFIAQHGLAEAAAAGENN